MKVIYFGRSAEFCPEGSCELGAERKILLFRHWFRRGGWGADAISCKGCDLPFPHLIPPMPLSAGSPIMTPPSLPSLKSQALMRAFLALIFGGISKQVLLVQWRYCLLMGIPRFISIFTVAYVSNAVIRLSLQHPQEPNPQGEDIISSWFNPRNLGPETLDPKCGANGAFMKIRCLDTGDLVCGSSAAFRGSSRPDLISAQFSLAFKPIRSRRQPGEV